MCGPHLKISKSVHWRHTNVEKSEIFLKSTLGEFKSPSPPKKSIVYTCTDNALGQDTLSPQTYSGGGKAIQETAMPF